LPEALTIARTLDLDLVEVAPMANPPVCRIMDYGKFKFDEAQRAKESRRKTVHVGIKEMKYRPKIGPGDFDTKTRQVARFLGEGHKVKITIMFRGREVFHPELGKKILDRIAEQMGDSAKVEAEPRLDGRNMVMVLAPDKRARQSAASRANTRDGGGAEGGNESAEAGAATGRPAGGQNTGGQNTGGQNTGGQNTGDQNTGGQNGPQAAAPSGAAVQVNGDGPATNGEGAAVVGSASPAPATTPTDGEG
jgi:translation initiation factor IF-3